MRTIVGSRLSSDRRKRPPSWYLVRVLLRDRVRDRVRVLCRARVRDTVRVGVRDRVRVTVPVKVRKRPSSLYLARVRARVRFRGRGTGSHHSLATARIESPIFIRKP